MRCAAKPLCVQWSDNLAKVLTMLKRTHAFLVHSLSAKNPFLSGAFMTTVWKLYNNKISLSKPVWIASPRTVKHNAGPFWLYYGTLVNKFRCLAIGVTALFNNQLEQVVVINQIIAKASTEPRAVRTLMLYNFMTPYFSLQSNRYGQADRCFMGGSFSSYDALHTWFVQFSSMCQCGCT